MPSRFVFVAIQPGAERALKNEIAREHPELRFAFSRPGFVTFRAPGDLADDFVLRSVFARTWGFSLGKVSGGDDSQLAREAWRLFVEQLPHEAIRDLHVWQRDRALPGDEGYDGAADELARSLHALLLEHRPATGKPRIADGAAVIADLVLVERNEWWLGWHRAGTPETRWPGGVPPMALPPRMISRAYLKLIEALEWSELPMKPGDRCVEIGSAPGGSCLALLERGLLVTGIDPAAMDPEVLAHPGFTHIRAIAKNVKRSVFRECRWLVMDANVAPNYTLDTLDGVLTQGGARPEGLVLTLKLTDPALVEELPAIAERIRRYGYRRVRMRQLAYNRQEICVVVDQAGQPK
ncbi:MAG TPA: SAM-dependent methyltransferase [Polyangiales bacterium]|nr:SAM-dependent methyltransferase [Polyangiales bacterium]